MITPRTSDSTTKNTEPNPLIRVKIDLEIDPEMEELIARLHRRELDQVETGRVQNWLVEAYKKLNNKKMDFEKELHHHAYANTLNEGELIKREKQVAKREKKVGKEDPNAGREAYNQRYEEIMKEMPDVMDAKGTTEWMMARRKMSLANWAAIAETDPDPKVRMTAETRLSNEDRGQHGKNLRDEEDDSVMPVILIEKGTYRT